MPLRGKGGKDKPLKNKKVKKGKPTAEEIAFKKQQAAGKKAEKVWILKMFFV
jgi:hypothetical protein